MGEVLQIANTYSAYATQYHRLGFIPIPAKADTKAPLVRWKELQNGISPSQLGELVASHGSAACMGTVIPVMSPFFVLDFDDGAYKALCDGFPYALPTNTPVARSGGVSASTGERDRYHVYYKWGHHRSLAKSFKEGTLFDGVQVALKADRSFAVLPPSTHKSGNRYEWLPGQAPWEVNMQEPPELIIQALLMDRGVDFEKYKPSGHDYKTVRELANMREGRNSHMTSELGWVRRQTELGFDVASPDKDKLRAYAEKLNEMYAEPLDDSEVDKIVDSSFRMWQDEASAENVTTVTKNGKEYEINEVGVTDRFVDDMKGKMAYLADRKTWCMFNQKFWEVQQKDAIGPQEVAVEALVRGLPDEANPITDDDIRKATKKQLMKLKANILGNVGKVRSLITHCEGKTATVAARFNTNKELLNFANGTIDLDDYSFKPHSAADMLTKCAPAEYDPDAKCPRWESFLMEAFEGDEERVRYLQKALGYALTGNCDHMAFFVLHGQGNNGKSIMMHVLSNLLGRGEDGYAYPAKINSFLATRGTDDKIGNDILDMAGHRLVYAEEPRKNAVFNDGLLKDLSAGGPQTGRRLRENLQQFDFTAKLFFLCNHLPRLDDTGRGIKRRVCVIPFGKGIDDDKVDRHLPRKLIGEASGILNWLIAGHKALKAGGDQALSVQTCPAVAAATAKYLAENDLIGLFLEDCCDLGPGYSVKTALVRSCYEAWLNENGYDRASSAQGVVNDGLLSAGLGEPRKSHGESKFKGLKLKDEWVPRADSVYGARKQFGGGTEY